MKREVSPSPVRLEARQLWEPLPGHVERSEVPRPLEDARELAVPDDVDRDGLAGGDVARQRDTHVGLVIVAGPRALRRWPQIDGGRPFVRAREREAADVDVSPVRQRLAPAKAANGLAQKDRAFVLERVQVQVHPQLTRRRVRGVAPSNRPFSVDGVGDGIERCRHGVIGHVFGVRRHGGVAVEGGVVDSDRSVGLSSGRPRRPPPGTHPACRSGRRPT